MMPPYSCWVPGEEAGDVDESDDGDVEAVAEADEAGGFAGGVDVEDAGEGVGVVGDDADAVAAEVGEADDDVARPLGLDFEELAVVDDAADDLAHVVGACGVGVDEVDEVVDFAVGWVAGCRATGGLPCCFGGGRRGVGGRC